MKEPRRLRVCALQPDRQRHRQRYHQHGWHQVGNVAPNTSPIDPRLGPLADSGGPTRTHALLAGSPAIAAASAQDCPPTDQRGVSRSQGGACDIGSYERE